jgi:hypothetical protein
VFIPDPERGFRGIAQKSTGSGTLCGNIGNLKRQECTEKDKFKDLVRMHKPEKIGLKQKAALHAAYSAGTGSFKQIS